MDEMVMTWPARRPRMIGKTAWVTEDIGCELARERVAGDFLERAELSVAGIVGSTSM
jgi:hypothetical protein